MVKNNSLRNINKGINSQPEIFDGTDVLHHSLKKSIDGSKLLPGTYKGKVVSVKRNLDPKGIYLFEVMVWIPELHVSVPEPKIYPNITYKEVQGLKFFKPISYEAEEPCVGMVVNVEITDPNNIIGYYVGISNPDFDIKGDRFYTGKVARDLEKSPREAVEQASPKNNNGSQDGTGPDNQASRSTNTDSKEDLLKKAKQRNRNINDLTPEAKEKIIILLEKIRQENLPFMIWETKRSQLRQNYLYTKSRTTKQVRAAGITEFDGDPNAPWATGTLNSNHKYGNAVDMVLDKNHPYFRGKRKPKNPWDLDPEFMPLWKRYRELANGIGLFTFGTDWPHVSAKRG